MEEVKSASHAKPYSVFAATNEPQFKDEDFKAGLQSHWIGSQPFEVAIRSIATVPAITTIRHNTLVAFPEPPLEEVLSIVDGKDCCGRINSALKDVIEVKRYSELPVVVSEYEHKVLIDQRCACYVLRGASIFCKGVMASTNFALNDKVSVYYTNKQYSNGTIITHKDFTQTANSLILIGNGIARMSRKDALSIKQGTAIEMTELFAEKAFPFSFAKLSRAKYYPQNMGSALVAHILEPKEGEVMLDVCAAPGGKTTHLAILAKNKARIVAVDKSGERLKLLEKTALEQGIDCIECYKGDSMSAIKPGVTLSNGSSEITFSEGMFDKIVVDPPCSSIGVRPFLGIIATTAKEVNHLVKVQRQILSNAFKLLKKGGLLTYSTCTITPWENEENVRYAIDELGMKLVKPKTTLVPPVPNSVLSEQEANCVQRIELSSNYNGFFVALFTKE
eukprot:TRINITY_DN14973_c0_g1_i3.p1 TRINITY_DN14973_c0_g1~~TRINITY_DN14973_c0_g1_i3.p1  ORF type:complete len:448 (+),score=104.21 TRINITY_DN14973_c0_g1_i3:53-1396(+)